MDDGGRGPARDAGGAGSGRRGSACRMRRPSQLCPRRSARAAGDTPGGSGELPRDGHHLGPIVGARKSTGSDESKHQNAEGDSTKHGMLLIKNSTGMGPGWSGIYAWSKRPSTGICIRSEFLRSLCGATMPIRHKQCRQERLIDGDAAIAASIVLSRASPAGASLEKNVFGGCRGGKGEAVAVEHGAGEIEREAVLGEEAGSGEKAQRFG